jgi:HemY protein
VSRRKIDKMEGRRQRAVMLAAAARDAQDKNPDEAMDLASQALKTHPGLVPAAEIVARRHSAKGDFAKASKVLEAAYKENQHPDIAEAYLAVRYGDTALDRLKRARYLAKLVPEARESKFIVARAALDAREFALARAQLEALVLARPTVRACLMMAELEETENGNEGLVRSWLARASRAPRDPIWVGDGVVSENWSPVSPLTGKIGGFEWREPPQAIEQDLRTRIDVVRVDPAPTPDPAPAVAPMVIEAQPQPEQSTAEPVLEVPSEPAPEPLAEPAKPEAVETKPLPFFDATTGEIRPIVPDDPGPEGEPAPRKKGLFSLFG